MPAVGLVAEWYECNQPNITTVFGGLLTGVSPNYWTNFFSLADLRFVQPPSAVLSACYRAFFSSPQCPMTGKHRSVGC
jgi:hypothetical protein